MSQRAAGFVGFYPNPKSPGQEAPRKPDAEATVRKVAPAKPQAPQAPQPELLKTVAVPAACPQSVIHANVASGGSCAHTLQAMATHIVTEDAYMRGPGESKLSMQERL